MSFKKRSVSLYGHQTSLALEPEFWQVIDNYIVQTNQSLAQFLREQDDLRLENGQGRNLASHLRVWALNHVSKDTPIPKPE
jgi:predicted DNA-binding ribbon-helix-helix protein